MLLTQEHCVIHVLVCELILQFQFNKVLYAMSQQVKLFWVKEWTVVASEVDLDGAKINNLLEEPG